MVRTIPHDTAAWRLLLEAHAALTDLLEHELVEERDLPLAWYDVLVQLEAAPGKRLRMQRLASSLLISKSGISRLVDRMVDAGLIGRASCPTDRRGAFAVLTPEGQGVLEDAAPVHLRGIEQHFAAHLSDRELATLAAILEKLVTAVGRERGCTVDAARAGTAAPATQECAG